MAELLPWAIGGDLPIKVLAVLGGAAVGAFLTGWLTALVVKGVFRQNLPRWPAWGLRALGGVLFGWLVALWVFGGGGGGLGGAGGWGLGSGKGKGPEPADKFVKADGKEKEKDKDKDGKGKNGPPAADAETLRVEVLGDAPLKKIAKGDDFDPRKRYRVIGEPGLLTLEQVKELVRQRRKGEPALRRLEVIVYLDSPARELPHVSALADWARDLEDKGKGRLRVDFSEPDRYAPVE